MKRGDILIGVGAGLVSAVLFATVIRGSLAGILLFYLTPLPIAIVSLGWNHRSGLVASGVGALAVGLIFNPLLGLMFALAFALPLWWLSFLALLARHGAQVSLPRVSLPQDSLANVAAPNVSASPAVPPTPHWYPLGMLAIWAAGLSVALTLGGAMLLGPDYETFRAAVQEMVEIALKSGMDELPGLGAETLPAERIASLVASVFLPLTAGGSTLLSLVILLVAAKIVSLSGRLPRPLPSIARDFVLPRSALIGLVASFVLAPFPGWPRFVAFALVGTIGMLLAMQGLATAHVLLARIPARPFILGVAYAMIVIVFPWVLMGLAIFGLVEMALALRARSLAHAASRKLN
ncbi:Predicted membrane protein [Rhizobiales bacterium GAS113]|nr:Predicted membrane protein [Rhizobiales bacterium GAS113]